MNKINKVVLTITLTLILVLTITIVILNRGISYAAGEKSGSISINCPSTLSSGSTMTCTLNGSITGTNYKGVEADVSISSNLELVEFTNSIDGAYGGLNTTRLTTAISTEKSGSFEIGKIKLKGKSGVSGVTEQISLSNVEFSDSENQQMPISSASRTVRIPSTNNNLSSLSVSGASISFNPNTTTYNVTVNASNTTISASLADNNSTLSGTGTKSLNYGKNTYKVNVKSEAGVTKTYTINITRPDNRSTNNYLSSLSLSSGKISFKKGTTNYNVSIGSSVSSVKISASIEDKKSSYVSGYNPRTVKLNSGTTKAQIKVMAENGSVRTYTINITKAGTKASSNTKSGTSKNNTTKSNTPTKSSDNKLKTLYLSNGYINFKSDKTEYKVDVSNKVKELDIKGDLSSDKAKVEGLGKQELKVGENVFKIKVTAENGDEKTYTLRINRKDKESSSNLDSNNYLKSLKIEGYKIEFSKTKYKYEVDLKGNKRLEIDAQASSKDADVTIMGNENLKNKDKIKIVVTAEDGTNRVYTIEVKENHNIMYTAIGIFIIGFLSLLVAFAYKKKKDSNVEYVYE
ncbi:MAG: cadherin-like beta sandwich domain-containing protein [Bacilli bacterium]|nr:cadherin-like beta sandwich domain-containing protein [Bacilli bacterium]